MDTQKLSNADFFRWSIDALSLTISIDKKGIIQHIGEEYAKILEMEREDIIGRPIEKIIPNTRLLQVMVTGKADLNSVFIMKNNIPIVVNRYPILDDNGEIQGAICITGITDLSRFEALNESIVNLLQENKKYRDKLSEISKSMLVDSVIGQSGVMERARELVEKVADSELTVLFTGETGTGKEVFANYLQQLSSRKLESFVKINCAAIPKDLLESELFGYVDGAFSGAKKGGKQGKFELADNGTILLDEIGELPFELQSKLLRVLQEKEVERIGGVQTKKINTRVVCCTNQNLEELVSKKKFRKDLYYRIHVVEIRIPPLRERLDDIALLCRHFIKMINKYNGIAIDGITDRVIEVFTNYDWPGNVRELEHILERACIMSSNGVLDLDDFEFFMPRLSNKNLVALMPDSLAGKKRQVERQAILDALQKTDWNKTRAAKILGMSRSVLYDKIKLHQIVREPGYGSNA